MTSRQARKQRREQERQAKKAAYKAARNAPAPPIRLEDEFSPEFLAEARAARERVARRVAAQRGDEAAFLSEPKTQADEAAFLSEPKTQADEAASLSEPKTQADEPAFLSAAKTQAEAFVPQNEPPAQEPRIDDPTHSGHPEPYGLGRAKTRRDINRANAAYSTGPRSSSGKLASSRNSLKHGLASGELIIPGEDRTEFETLLESLFADHQPGNTTEEMLIHEMAQSWWLTQRALRLQNDCFTAEGVNEKQLSLFLRYQTTHERAFHKALNTLLKLKQSRARGCPLGQAVVPRGFVSHDQAPTSPASGFVSQNGIQAPESSPHSPSKPPEKDHPASQAA